MPILAEPAAVPAQVQMSPITINGLAVAVMLGIAAIVAVVWAVDDHFISRREFNLHMQTVTAQLHAINARLGVVAPPAPPVAAGNPPIEP